MIRILTENERMDSRRTRALAMGISEKTIREFEIDNPAMWEHAFKTACSQALRRQLSYRESHPIRGSRIRGGPGGPGGKILEHMNGSSCRSVAPQMGVSHVSLLKKIHNKQRITADFAWKLARHFNTSSAYWVDLQREWDERGSNE